MKRNLKLFYVRKIPKVELNKMNGKNINEIKEIVNGQGYDLLYFSKYEVLSNMSGFKDIKPYLSEPIKVNCDYIIDEDKIKKDYKAPQYCLNCIDQQNDAQGTLFIFLVKPPKRQETEFTAYIPNKKIKEKYLKPYYEDICCVYAHFLDSLNGECIDYLFKHGMGKTKDTLHFYQLSEEMFGHAMSVIDNDFCLSYIKNTREGFFYQFEQD